MNASTSKVTSPAPAKRMKLSTPEAFPLWESGTWSIISAFAGPWAIFPTICIPIVMVKTAINACAKPVSRVTAASPKSPNITNGSRLDVDHLAPAALSLANPMSGCTIATVTSPSSDMSARTLFLPSSHSKNAMVSFSAI